MVIGGFGYCDYEGNLQFHRNVLEGIQIYNGSLLFGVYHPRSKYDDQSDRIKYHFMISPIPYHLWPKTARFIIRLKQEKTFGQTTGIKEISNFLKSEEINVSLIYSFSNRSAHRYSTWDIHVSFDNFSLEDLKDDYDVTRSCYSKILLAAEDLEIKLKERFSQYLFTDKDDLDLKNSIIRRVNTSCHYFYYDTERLSSSGNENSKLIYKHFTLRYNNGNFIPTEKGKINELISLLQPNKVDFELPTICFSETDSHYLNIRIIIIPKKLRHKFFKVSVFHERLKSDIINNPTSRGLLNFIIGNMQEWGFKIWKTSTLLFECRSDSYGNGKLSLFIEDKENFGEDVSTSKKNWLTTKLEELDNFDEKPENIKHIRLKSRVEKVFPDVVSRYFERNRKSLAEREKQYDLFISYSHFDSEYAEILCEILKEEKCKYFIDKEGTIPGDILSNKIEDGLKHSREFCILLSDESVKSGWVFTEWGAASILEKTIVPILLPTFDREKHKGLDVRLQALNYIKWPANPREALRKYARQIIERRFDSLLENDNYHY